MVYAYDIIWLIESILDFEDTMTPDVARDLIQSVEEMDELIESIEKNGKIQWI